MYPYEGEPREHPRPSRRVRTPPAEDHLRTKEAGAESAGALILGVPALRPVRNKRLLL